MTKITLFSVIGGILAGYFLFPQPWIPAFLDLSEYLLVIGLSLLLLFVGIDLGLEGTVVKQFKKVGWKMIFLPIGGILGTFLGALIVGLILPLSLREALAIGAGFGWYTLAPVMLTRYSAEISAISFIHNVMRELFGIILIPLVAKRIGYVETCALPGAAAMDVCMPMVEKATTPHVAVYSFVSGVMMSFAVPIFVPLFAGI